MSARSTPPLLVVAVSFLAASAASDALAQCDSGMPGQSTWEANEPSGSEPTTFTQTSRVEVWASAMSKLT